MPARRRVARLTVVVALVGATLPLGGGASAGAAPLPPGGIVLDVLAPVGSGALPVTVGVPVPEAVAGGPWRVVGDSGPVPTQVRERVRQGPDGLVWLLVDFVAESARADYRLGPGAGPATSDAVTVTEVPSGAGVVVDTGVGRWSVPATTDLLADVEGADGRALVTGAGFGASHPAELTVTERGPVRAQVELRARDVVQGLDLVARLHFFAGLPYARASITLVNHRRCRLERNTPPDADNGPFATEPNQPSCNGLASANRVTFDDLTWGVQVAEPEGPDEVLFQDSSGTEHWDAHAGMGPRMQSGVRRRGYLRTVNGTTVATGDVADGSLASGSVRLRVPWFRELFPKALRRDGGRLEVGLWPGEYALDHVLRAGEQKTHDVYVVTDPDAQVPFPVYAAPDVSWLAATEALGPLVGRTAADGPAAAYEQYLADQLDAAAYDADECNNDVDECARSLFDARERFDYYGWTDFGDIPTDFEDPRSPYNLKYDANLGFLLQALRTDDPRWWEWAHASNVHFADIDILHSPVRGPAVDRAWWEGGTWGHSYHNERGRENPHRNYANPNPDTYWGGAGMTAWSLVTGDAMVEEAAVELADNTAWRMRNSSDTRCDRRVYGGGSGEGYAILEANARAVANATRILVSAWRLTGEPAYLETAGLAAGWVDCEADAILACASWKEALLARAIAEQVTAAGQAGVAVPDGGPDAVVTLAGALRDRLRIRGDRGWLVDCERFAEINAWELLVADVFTYAARLTGDASWLDQADATFTTGAEDPYYRGDTSQYHSAKELVNVVDDGLVYLAARLPAEDS